MSKASEQAYEIIRAMIISGELGAGTQISEEQLAASCGVSRTPVREALRRLETESFINRSGSQRSFVAEWSLHDIKDAFELRALLESQAAKCAAPRINAAQIKLLRTYNNKLGAAVSHDQPDVAGFLEYNRLFHETIVEAAGSDRLARMLATVVEQPVVLRTAQRYDRQNLARAHYEHDELVQALSAGDAQWAAAIMTGHIRRALHAYVHEHEKSAKIHSATIAA